MQFIIHILELKSVKYCNSMSPFVLYDAVFPTVVTGGWSLSLLSAEENNKKKLYKINCSNFLVSNKAEKPNATSGLVPHE